MRVTIHLAPSEVSSAFYFAKDQVTLAVQAYKAGKYAACDPVMVFDKEGEDAAEEMFDLTNNPMRQGQREAEYGRGRSVSTGDIVSLESGAAYLCMSSGWECIAWRMKDGPIKYLELPG